MLNYAGRLAPAGLVSVVRASDIVFAYCFEILLFAQRPNFFTWIGVALVLGSLLLIGIEKIKESKNNPQIPSPTAKKQTSEVVPGNGDENLEDGARKNQSSGFVDEESQELLPTTSKDE
jgi:hypothetical protein